MPTLIQVGERLMTPKQIRSSRRWKRLAMAACPPGTICPRCGRQIIHGLPKGHPAGPSADHIIPLAKGGAPFDPANVAPLCAKCNREKSDKLSRQSASW